MGGGPGGGSGNIRAGDGGGIEALDDPNLDLTDEDKDELQDLLNDLDDILKQSMNQAGSGIDPTAMVKIIQVGGVLIRRGVRKFLPWANQMIKLIGERVRKYLRMVYMGLIDTANERHPEGHVVQQRSG